MTTKEILKELKNLKKSYDSTWDESQELLMKSNKLSREASELNNDVYRIKSEIAKSSVDAKLDEEQIMATVELLGGLIKKHNEVAITVEEARKAYMDKIKEYDKVKLKINKLKKKFWKENELETWS